MDTLKYSLMMDFFVCRLKSKTVIYLLEEFVLPEGGDAVSDTVAFIGATAKCTKSVFQIIVIPEGEGEEFYLITDVLIY